MNLPRKIDPECIIKQGYLVKSPPMEESSILGKRWRMRWFVLYNFDGHAHLFYFRDEKSVTKGPPKGKTFWINLACVRACMRACIHVCYVCMHSCMHATTHACMHAYIRTYIHACTHARMRKPSLRVLAINAYGRHIIPLFIHFYLFFHLQITAGHNTGHFDGSHPRAHKRNKKKE